MRRKLKAISGIMAFFLFSFGLLDTHLVYPEFFSDDYGVLLPLDIIIGESKVVRVSNPKKLAIGDPAIVDIASASKTEILLSAKKPGETNLRIWDDSGQKELTVRVFEEDLGKLKKRLEDLFFTAGIRGITFQAGDKERKIFVLGDIPLRKKEVVTQLLANFQDKIINLLAFKEENPLVEIDVQILEIAKTVIDQLGIDWTTTWTFSEVAPTAAHTFTKQVTDALRAIGASRFTRTSLQATVHLLENDNLARTLARPKLVTLSGKEAKFLVGGSIPILANVSVSSGTTTTSVDYIDFGIKLNILPEVKENGDIATKLEVEIKTVDTTNQLTVLTGSAVSTSTPGFKTRNASTELYLKNEKTIFLAGLIDNQETNNLAQVPALGNLPIIGALFRSKDFQVGDTELVISITPKIVNYGDLSPEFKGGGVKKGFEESPTEAYKRAIQEVILKSVVYPLEAQRSNLSGVVSLSLHLLSTGHLVGVVVHQSSGHKLLDQSAVFTVKKLAPFPAFPPGLILKEIWLEVPITYQLS